MKKSYVYFMSSYDSTILYVGVTNDIERRAYEHKTSLNINSFTSKYKCFKLVWFEEHTDISVAINREKQLKNWKREWKEALIKESNPDWDDLAKDWYLNTL